MLKLKWAFIAQQLIAILCIGFLFVSPVFGIESGQFKVDISDKLITVSAKDVNLVDLVSKISEELDVKIHLIGNVESYVSGSLSKVSLEELLERIAENWSLVRDETDKQAIQKEIYLLPKAKINFSKGKSPNSDDNPAASSQPIIQTSATFRLGDEPIVFFSISSFESWLATTKTIFTDEQYHIILKLDPEYSGETQKLFNAHGIEIKQFIASNSYKVSVPDSASSVLADIENGLVGWAPIPKNAKMDYKLRRKINENSPDSMKAALFFYDNVPEATQKKILDEVSISATGTIKRISDYEVRVVTDITKLNTIANYNALRNIWTDIREKISTNWDARDTSNIDEIHPTTVANAIGDSGYDLTGEGIKLGIWELGEVRETHEQFKTGSNNPRITQVEKYINTSIDDHATHVCSTMIGDGETNIAAVGVAPNAEANAYIVGWGVAEYIEIGNSCAGMVASNHSYGLVAGWAWSTHCDNNGDLINDYEWLWRGGACTDEEDIKFGKYDFDSQEIDKTAYNNSHHIIVKTAGNDRDNNPPAGEGDKKLWEDCNGTNPCKENEAMPPLIEGNAAGITGYDTIAGWGLAKNVITVGAVLDITNDPITVEDIQPTDFTSYGPADDGRIKPDLVANGFELLSAVSSSDTAYEKIDWSGTSMAAPVVTGTCALLAEQYKSYNSDALPNSSLIKAILINTAIDDSEPRNGPDYRIGWGLMNARAAADLIHDHHNSTEKHFLEGEYTGGEIIYRLYVPDQTAFTTTMVWNDPAGAENTSGVVDNSIKSLVNDLDITITSPDGTVFQSWQLNPDDPTAPATNNGNHTDNVEQIDIRSEDATPGIWTISVKHNVHHNGIVINDVQPFSLVASLSTQFVEDDYFYTTGDVTVKTPSARSWLTGFQLNAGETLSLDDLTLDENQKSLIDRVIAAWLILDIDDVESDSILSVETEGGGVISGNILGHCPATGNQRGTVAIALPPTEIVGQENLILRHKDVFLGIGRVLIYKASLKLLYIPSQNNGGEINPAITGGSRFPENGNGHMGWEGVYSDSSPFHVQSGNNLSETFNLSYLNINQLKAARVFVTAKGNSLSDRDAVIKINGTTVGSLPMNTDDEEAVLTGFVGVPLEILSNIYNSSDNTISIEGEDLYVYRVGLAVDYQKNIQTPEIVSGDVEFGDQIVPNGGSINITKGDLHSISASAQDEHQISSMEIFIDSVLVQEAGPFVPGEPGSVNYDWDTSGLQTKTYTIEINVTDSDGLVNTYVFYVILEEEPEITPVIPYIASNSDGGFSLDSGETQTVRFLVENMGELSSITDSGYIVISVSDGLDIINQTSVSGEVGFEHFDPGDSLSNSTGSPVPLMHKTLRGYTTYGPGDYQIVDVTFQASSSGTHFIKYRATFAYEDSGLEWANFPVSGEIFPPQNWPVKTINVNTAGTGPARIVTLPEQFNFGTLGENSTAEDYLYIQNLGGETLTWEITDLPDWITASRLSGSTGGGLTSTVILTADATVLYPDDDPVTGEIEIQSNTGDTKIIPVEIIVTESTVFPPIYAAKDAYISGDLTEQNQNFGNLSYFEVGEKDFIGKVGFVEFDLSGLPENIRIESAKMYLHAYDLDTSDDDKIRVNKVIDFLDHDAPWFEETITWNDRPGVESPIIDLVTVKGTGKTVMDITALAQMWYSGDYDNYGVALRPHDTSGNALLTKFYSAEHPDINLRPYLEISYTPIDPDFRITVTPNPGRIDTPGESVEFQLSVDSLGGYSGNVFFSCFGNLPSDLDSPPSFSNNNIGMGETTTLTIDTSETTPKGYYQFTVQGASGGIVHNINITLQVGKNLGPSVVIHDVSGLAEPSNIITINYTAVDPSDNPMTTRDWQFSMDSTDGVDGTWFDIEESAIGNNDSKASGIQSYITWDTTSGSNNLNGIQNENIWFRMKADNGVAMLSIVEEFYFSSTDFTGISYHPSSGRIWSVEDSRDGYVYEHDNSSLEIINEYGFGPEPAECDDPYGITWIDNDTQGNERFFIVDERGGNFDDEGEMFLYRPTYADEMPPNYQEDFDINPSSDYGTLYFGGMAWDGTSLWSCIFDGEDRIFKHYPESLNWRQIEEDYPAPGTSPSGLTWDGDTIWSCDSVSNTIYKHNMDSELSVAEEYTMSYIPTGLTWDGTYLYSCTEDYIYKHNAFPQFSSYVSYGGIQIDNNFAPIMNDLPDQTVEEDDSLSGAIDLWGYTYDIDNPQEELQYQITGMSDARCGATIRENQWVDIAPHSDWYGTSEVLIQVSDGMNPPVVTSFEVTVTPLNDAPQISFSEPIIFDENSYFSFDLDDFAGDIDNISSELEFSFSGNTNISVNIDSVTHIVTLTAPDNWDGGPESIRFTVSDPEGLAAYSDVDVSVYDILAPRISTDLEFLMIPESESAILQVRLSSQPLTTVEVGISKVSGDEDISVLPPSLLTFTPTNWDQYQEFVITASEDSDTARGYAEFRLSSPSMPSVSVSVLEIENDPVLDVHPVDVFDFGRTGPGTTKESAAFVFTNSGGGNVSGTLSTSGSFAIHADDQSINLGPGDSKTIRISFSPVDLTTYSAELVADTSIGMVRRSITGQGALASINGGVYETDGTTPINGGMGVYAYRAPDHSFAGSAVIGSNGLYEITDLLPGDYYLIVEPSLTDHVHKYYDNALDFDDAQIITINDAENIDGINFYLEMGGGFSGYVYDADGNVITDASIRVDAIPLGEDALQLGRWVSQSDGSFMINGLAPGQYRILANAYKTPEYESKYYPDNLDWYSAQIITVEAGSIPALSQNIYLNAGPPADQLNLSTQKRARFFTNENNFIHSEQTLHVRKEFWVERWEGSAELISPVVTWEPGEAVERVCLEKTGENKGILPDSVENANTPAPSYAWNGPGNFTVADSWYGFMGAESVTTNVSIPVDITRSVDIDTFSAEGDQEVTLEVVVHDSSIRRLEVRIYFDDNNIALADEKDGDGSESYFRVRVENPVVGQNYTFSKTLTITPRNNNLNAIRYIPRTRIFLYSPNEKMDDASVSVTNRNISVTDPDIGNFSITSSNDVIWDLVQKESGFRYDIEQRRFIQEIDAKAPEVSARLPEDDTENVPVDSPIVVTFSEPMDTLRTEREFILSDELGNPVHNYYKGIIGGTISWNDQEDVMTFTPTSPFKFSTGYEMEISGRDKSGEWARWVPEGFWWDFVTQPDLSDAVSPTVISVWPYNGAENVSTAGTNPVRFTTHITAMFSEAMDVNTLTQTNVELVSTTDGSIVPCTLSYMSRYLEIIPDAPLAPDTLFECTLSTNIQDAAGNQLGSDYTWQFRTGAKDESPPVVLDETVPENGTGDMDVWYPRVNIFFNEELDPETVNKANITLEDDLGNQIDFYPYYVNKNYGLRIRKDASRRFLALDQNRTYTLTIGTGVADRAGNFLTEAYVYTFTTVASEGNSLPNLDRIRYCDVTRTADGIEFKHKIYAEDNDWYWPGEGGFASVSDGITTWPLWEVSTNWAYYYESTDGIPETIGDENQTLTFELTDSAGNAISKSEKVFVFSETPLISMPTEDQSLESPLTISWDSLAFSQGYQVRLYNGIDRENDEILWYGYVLDDGSSTYSLTLPEDLKLVHGYAYYYELIAYSGLDWVSPFGMSSSGVRFVYSAGTDSDGDNLIDTLEVTICTDVNDADTDDDGILDGEEDKNRDGKLDPGETDPCDADTDGDGIQDGTESGLTLADIGPDTDQDVFQPDLNPATQTDPRLKDTDGDLIPDGLEDLNHNGQIDECEQDPAEKTYSISPDRDNDGDVDGLDIFEISKELDSGSSDLCLASALAYLGQDIFPADPDNDGILSDGDFSGVEGDTPCPSGISNDCDDNCPDVANPLQEDFNDNGYGDVCEDYSDATINGPWAIMDPSGGFFYIVADGFGNLTDVGLFHLIGTYRVELDGTVEFNFENTLNPEGAFDITGQMTSGTEGDLTGEFSGWGLKKISNPSAGQGDWTGALTETGGTVFPVEFTVDSTGTITSLTGFSGPVSGRMFVQEDKFSGFINTGEAKPYNNINMFGDISGNTLTGQYSVDNGSSLDGTISLSRPSYVFDPLGYWDLTIPVVDEGKIDAYYFFQSYPDLAGVNLLGSPFTGNASGPDITLSYPDGSSFSGAIESDVISGIFNVGGTDYTGSLERASLYLTHLYPGETLTSLTPTFTWSESPGADKYFIRIMRDNADGTCGEDGNCQGVWEIAGITDTQVVFNADGNASETLSPLNNYRIRVYSRTAEQTGIPAQDPATYIDKTMDVLFRVCDDCDTAIDLTGFWDLYSTEEGGTEEGPEFWRLEQTGDALSGFWWRCGDDEAITGSVKGNLVSLSFPESEDGPFSVTGTFYNNEVSGVFGNIFWRAVKRAAEPECIKEVEVQTHQDDATWYYLHIKLKNFDPATISDVIAYGDNVSETRAQSDPLLYTAFLSSPHVMGEAYTIRVNYTDSTYEEFDYTITSINTTYTDLTEIINTLVPKFTWQAVTGIDGYFIQVQKDDTDEQVWFREFPADVISTDFNSDGTASESLQSGVTYRVSMGTYDSEWNQATTRTTFTVE